MNVKYQSLLLVFMHVAFILVKYAVIIFHYMTMTIYASLHGCQGQFKRSGPGCSKAG